MGICWKAPLRHWRFREIATLRQGQSRLAILRFAPCFPKGRGRHICEGVRRKYSGSVEDILCCLLINVRSRLPQIRLITAHTCKTHAKTALHSVKHVKHCKIRQNSLFFFHFGYFRQFYPFCETRETIQIINKFFKETPLNICTRCC